MELPKFREKAAELKEKAAQFEGAALEKITQSIEEFNKAVPVIKALGLSITDVKVQAGVLPEIRAKLVGSIEAIDAGRIQEAIDKNQEKKLLVALLQALQMASHVAGIFKGLEFAKVAVDFKLGLVPDVGVTLLEKASGLLREK